MAFAPACVPSEVGGCSTPGAPRDATVSAPFEPARGARANRLRRRGEFERLLRQGRRVQYGPLEARYTRGAAGRARLGVIVGRRAAPGAVRRSRLKRLLRESFRARTAALPALDVVLRITRLPDNEAELRTALDSAWCRIVHETRG